MNHNLFNTSAFVTGHHAGSPWVQQPNARVVPQTNTSARPMRQVPKPVRQSPEKTSDPQNLRSAKLKVLPRRLG